MQPFHVTINLSDYQDILPPIPDDDREIINSEIDDINQQYWRLPDFPHIITVEFLEREIHRIKHGVWIMIKGVLLWIPGNYYFFLVYGNANGDAPQFRLKRLKNVYKKIQVRKNPRFVGTFNIKNRQDGDTTIGGSDMLWEIPSGELKNGMGGIQSKTRADAQLPCWFNMKMQWMGYPHFLKDEVFSHFTSGNNIEEKMLFSEVADPNNPRDKGKNVILTYGPSTHNAFDGKNNVRKLFLDEILKWIECDFGLTFTNYMKFMMPGKIRKGIFDIVSSPSDTNGKHNDVGYQFWKDSNPNDLQKDTGSTKSRIVRMYSNPLEGIEGYYDIFGDADPQEIYEHIQRERRNKPKDLLMAEVRGYPLPIIGTDEPNEDEIFGSFDVASIWINKKGIAEQRQKLALVKPTNVVYGNLEWPGNVQDSGEPEFRVADCMDFNDETARWCMSHEPKNKIALPDFKSCPHVSLIQESIGGDPFNLRYETKNKVGGSMGAAVSWFFRDFANPESMLQYCRMSYLARPWHKSIYMEDMILMCVYLRAMFNYENKDTSLEEHFEDRGYISWMLVDDDARRIQTPDGIKIKRGSPPDLNLGINFINGVTNRPLTPEQPYLLEHFKHFEVLDDVLQFDKSNTEKSHMTMAWMQALKGRNKILFKRQRKKSSVNNGILRSALAS